MKRLGICIIAVLVALTAGAQPLRHSTEVYPVCRYYDDTGEYRYALYNRMVDTEQTSFEYSGMSLVYEDIAVASLEDGSRYFLNTVGDRVYGGRWMTDATIFSDGIAWIADGKGNLTAVDKDFKPLFSAAAISAFAFHDGFSVIRTAQGYGILDTSGNLLGGQYYPSMDSFVTGGRISISGKNGLRALFAVEKGKAPKRLTDYSYSAIGLLPQDSGIRRYFQSMGAKYIYAVEDGSFEAVFLDRNSGKPRQDRYNYAYFDGGLFKCCNEEGEVVRCYDLDFNIVPDPGDEDSDESYNEEEQTAYNWKTALLGTDLFVAYSENGSALLYGDGRHYSDFRDITPGEGTTEDIYRDYVMKFLCAFSEPRFATIRDIEDNWGGGYYGDDPAVFYSSKIPMVTSETRKPAYKGAAPTVGTTTGAIIVDPTDGTVSGNKYKDMSLLSYGYALVLNDDGTYSYIDENGSLVFGGRRYKSASIFSYGLAFVCDFDGVIHCINTEGNDVYTLTGVEYVFSYNDGYAVMKTKQGGWGLVDTAGNIPFQNASWTNAYPYVCGYAFYVADSSGKWGSVLPYDGTNMIPFVYDGIGCQPTYGLRMMGYNLSGEALPAKIGEKYALISKDNGRRITAPVYDFLIRDGALFMATKDGKTGWIDAKGNTVVDLQYEWAGFLNGGMVAPVIKTDFEEGVIFVNLYGDKVSPRSYVFAENTPDGQFITAAVETSVDDPPKWILYDNKFNVLSDNLLAYERIRDTELFIVTDESGKYGIINEDGKFTVPLSDCSFNTFALTGMILPDYMYKWMTCFSSQEAMNQLQENPFQYY